MMKRKIIGLTALAAGALLCVSCGGASLKNTTLPPAIKPGNSETKEIFTLDETGLFATVKNVSAIEYGQDIPQTYKDLGIDGLAEKGVRVSGTSGATFYYTPVVDLNDVQGQNIVSFEVPHNDEFQIGGVTMEVVDIYDAQNKFTVTWFVKSNALMSNVLVGCNGVSKGSNSESGYELGYPRLEYGVTAYSVSFIEETRYGHLPFHFSYDLATEQVQGKFRQTDAAPQMYLDLDNAVHMGEKNVFGGFTTGEVYLKFTFDEVASGKTGAIVITDIAGKSLASETLKAESSDIIKLEMADEYRAEMPVGEKGKAYAVPKAIQSDLFVGECNVGCQVAAPSGVTTVVTDGVYTPTETGEYEVLYSTKDVNGFNVMKKIYFDVVESVQALALVSDTEDGANFFAGKAVDLPKISATGGSGLAAVNVDYAFNGKEITPDEDGRFVFEDKGTLTVKATATDYLGTAANAEFAYEIVSAAKIKLVAPMPKALTAGKTYYLPDFKGEVVGDPSGTLEKYITVDGEAVESNRKIVVPDSGTMQIVYTYGAGTTYKVEQSYEVAVLPASESLDVSTLFATSDGASVSATNAGVLITATGVAPQVDFVHAVSANYAGLFIQPSDNTASFEYLELTLTDAFDEENAVSFRVYKDTSMADNFRIQDKEGNYSVHHKILSNVPEINRLSFYYDNDTHGVYNTNNIQIATLKYTVNGKTFKGFECGAMFVSVKLGNAAVGADVCFTGLGNQAFEQELLAFGDIMKPQLATKSAVGDKTIALNGEYIVQKALALDVLQAKSSVKVSLVSPSGEKLLNNASITEDKQFTMDELGNYKLTYSMEDGVSGIENLVYTLTVQDAIAPTIEVKGEYKKTYRVGESIKLLGATVLDDISATEKITLYVIVYPADYLPDYYKVGDKVKLETEGHYNITYYAIDEAGNRGFAKFDIYVR